MESFAVIADIHSNVFALEAILGDIRSRDLTRIINLGDIFYGPIGPKNTYNILKKSGMITILGNQDRLLYEATPEVIESNKTLRYVLAEIGDAALAWLCNFRFTYTIDDRILLCHGTPESDLTYLLEAVTSGYPTLKSDADIQANLKGTAQEVVLCAHTHIPRTVKLLDGQLILNPGSVGMPAYQDDVPQLHKMETGSPHARYAILSRADEGWMTEHIQVPYDFEAAARAAERNGRLDWANILRTGRA